MLYHVRGELVHREPTLAVLECGGVGYALTVSLITSDTLEGSLGKTVKLYTHLQVREDGIELFGFYSKEELSAFKMLISVSGVGPKAAMSILSIFTPERFAFAVSGEDVKGLSKAPGVGAKTAARIVLELKDKIAKDSAVKPLLDGASAVGIAPSAPTQSADKRKLSEAVDALTVLGYNRNEILEILRKIDTSKLSLEEIITAALKQFARP